ncbi:uncharacterized protein LOC144472808 [Augochlora pura]
MCSRAALLLLCSFLVLAGHRCEENTTTAVTTEENTTVAVTTVENTTVAVTTVENTTAAVTTEENTTVAVTTEENTTVAVTTEENALARLVKLFSEPGAFKRINAILGENLIEESYTSCPKGEEGLECRRAEARRSVDFPEGKKATTLLCNPACRVGRR